MPVISKLLFRGAASTSNTTLYTQPNTSTSTVVTNIAVTNTAATAGTFTIKLDGVDLVSAAAIAANTTAFLDVKQVIPANNPVKTIAGSASATTINFHISGVEVS